jgi:hypothetical protein
MRLRQCGSHQRGRSGPSGRRGGLYRRGAISSLSPNARLRRSFRNLAAPLGREFRRSHLAALAARAHNRQGKHRFNKARAQNAGS